MALAWVELSTGTFHVSATTLAELSSQLARLSPSEVLVPSSVKNHYIRGIMKDYVVSFRNDEGDVAVDKNSCASLDSFDAVRILL